MWGLYFIGLVAYIPASPVQGYLTLSLKRLGFSKFDSNMLTIPSAALQVITMLALAYSSEFFDERTLHCIFGEFWILPLLTSLLTIPDGGREWSRFSIITLISGCEVSPCFHFDLANATQTHTSTLSFLPGYLRIHSTSRNEQLQRRHTTLLYKSAH